MARIVSFQGGNIQPDAPNVVPIRAPDFGAGVGAGVEKLGQAVGETANVADYVGQLHDEASVKEQMNGISQWYAEAGYTGPNALFAKKGKDALDTAPMVTKGLDDLIQQRRASLQNDRQRFLFDQAMNPQRIEWDKQIGTHAANETVTYATDESAGRAGMAGQMAGLTYANDPQEGEAHLSTMRDEIAKAGKLQGFGPDAIALKQFTASSAIYKDIGTSLVKEGPQGPDLARKFVDLHNGSMSDDDRQSILDHADVEQRSLAAEQRQAEADQRRIVEQGQRDNHAKAAAVLASVVPGIPISPDDYANAITAAKNAGPEGLEQLKQLQQFETKNTVLYAHRSDTPMELQTQINQLSAKIVKDGTNASASDVLARDSLQQLFDHSAEQLKSNGVAWLAQHQGMQVAPLNLMDPNSIGQRVQLVQQGSQHAGMDIAPLQPAEVQPLTQQWHNGDANAKASLVMQLAKFGPLSTAAAQQIAPNDAGLVHLIGLASHSNRGVAVSRVTQTMAGYEAMKTEGDLVGKTAKLPDFNQWTGSALQFMPGAKDGVFTVAKALLAQDASQHGWDMVNNQPDEKAWYRAVNSALGAYNRGDVQYGGLAGFNGAQTVLPENMSLDDFEGRVSRAGDQQFKAAGNGVPTFGNGTPLGAGDLKKMHFIPVDDGVYRLETGGSFVHTKDGRPFEIDVRKLSSAAAKGFSSSDFNQQLVAAGYVRH